MKKRTGRYNEREGCALPLPRLESILLLILLLALLCPHLAAQQPPGVPVGPPTNAPAPPAIPPAQGSPNQKQLPAASVVGPTTAGTHAQKLPARSCDAATVHDDAEGHIVSYTKWLMWFTFVYAIASIALAVIGAIQLRYLRRSMADTERSVSAAQALASAALDQSRTMRESLEVSKFYFSSSQEALTRASRPYVLPDIIDAQNLPWGPGEAFVNSIHEKPKAQFVSIVFRNHGSTPAIIKRVCARVTPAKDIPASLDLSKCAESGIHDPIAANSPSSSHGFYIDWENHYQPEISPGVIGGEYPWVIYGLIEYESFYGNLYYSEFCYRSLPSTRPAVFTTDGLDMYNKRS